MSPRIRKVPSQISKKPLSHTTTAVEVLYKSGPQRSIHGCAHTSCEHVHNGLYMLSWVSSKVKSGHLCAVSSGTVQRIKCICLGYESTWHSTNVLNIDLWTLDIPGYSLLFPINYDVIFGNENNYNHWLAHIWTSHFKSMTIVHLG